jgi:hypothetical protein
MDRLKLIALDQEDLPVISAHCQDAVLKAGDILWLPAEKRLVLGMNRFVWENLENRGKTYERRRAALHFGRVDKVRTRGIDRSNKDMVLSLLAVTFQPGTEPAGTIDLVFSGHAAMQLEVECIEAQLSDLAAAWETGSRPAHADE